MDDGKGKGKKTLSLAFFLPITPLASLRRDREREDWGRVRFKGLNLLLVLSLVPRGFYPGTPVFPFSTKTNTPKVQFDLELTDTFVRTPREKVRNCVVHVSFILLKGHCYIDRCYTKLNSISWI